MQKIMSEENCSMKAYESGDHVVQNIVPHVAAVYSLIFVVLKLESYHLFIVTL